MDQIVNIMTTTATAAEDSPDRTPVINIGPSIVDPILTRTHVDDVAVPISITTDVEDTDIQASYNNNTDTSGASSMATTTATTAAISTNTGVVISAYRSNSANQIASAKDSHLSKGICLSPNNSSGVTLGKQKRSSNTTENNSGSVKKESLIHRLFKRKTVPIGSIGRSGAGKAATFLSPVYENGNSSSGGTGLHQSPQQQQQQQQQYISPKPSVFAQKPIKRPVITVNVGTNTAPTDTNCNDAIGASSASNAESSASTSGTVTGSGYDGWPSKVSKGPSEDLLTQLSNYEFLLKAQKDNIRTLELALQECKLDSLQVVPLRYTIHTLKSQLESLQAENSALRSDSTSLDFKLLCYKDKVSKLEAQHCGAVDRAVAAETSVAKLTTTNRSLTLKLRELQEKEQIRLEDVTAVDTTGTVNKATESTTATGVTRDSIGSAAGGGAGITSPYTDTSLRPISVPKSLSSSSTTTIDIDANITKGKTATKTRDDTPFPPEERAKQRRRDKDCQQGKTEHLPTESKGGGFFSMFFCHHQ